MASRAIFSLLGGTDGSLWIGADPTLTRLKDGVLTEFKEHRGRINAIIQDRNGNVWITRSRPSDNDGPLCQATDTRLSCKGKADGITPPYGAPLIEDLEGNFWVGSATILTRWRVGSSVTFAPAGLKNPESLNGVQGLAVTRDGSIWCGINRKGRGLGLQQLIGDTWKPFAAPGLNGEDLEINALFVDREDTLWVGTRKEGVYRIHDGRAEHFRGADGLSGDTVTGFYEDREGDLWVATTEGIDSFRDIAVLTFSTREGLGSSSANSVLAAHDGTVWIGNSGSLDSIRGDKLDSVRLRAGQRVTSLFEDHMGQLWVGIDDALYIYKEGRFEGDYGRQRRSSLASVIAPRGGSGKKHLGSVGGEARSSFVFKTAKVREELFPPEVPHNLSLAADPNGGIWMGLLPSGLGRYRNHHLETFPFSKTQNQGVTQMVARPDGSVLGASGEGLVYWRNETARILTSQNGLPCDSLYSLTSGDDGVWLYAQCGLVHVPNQQGVGEVVGGRSHDRKDRNFRRF